MPELAQLVKWEIAIFLLALAGIIAARMLTGQINTSGLLHSKSQDKSGIQNGDFSPMRLQLLVFTLGSAFYYLSQVLNNPNPTQFPPLPQSWPAILGGSHLFYLGGKAYARWFAGPSSK
jgi:hypothetical protein